MQFIQCIPDVARDDVDICWPIKGETARAVISRSNRKVTYKVPHILAGKMLHAESQIERDFYRRIQLDPTVTKITPQPALLYYFDAGVVRKHYPDVLVIRKNASRVFVEIKSSSDPDLDDAYRRAELLTPGLQRQGFSYQLVTSDEIRKAPHLANAKTILRLGCKRVTQRDADCIIRLLEIRSTTCWQDLVSGQLGPEAPFQIAFLILEGKLSFDADQPLSGSTVITVTPHMDGSQESKNG